MVLDHARPAGQREDLVVSDGEPVSIAWRDRHVFDHSFAADVVDELEFLVANRLLKNRTTAVLQRRFENIILVGIDRTLNDVLAESVSCVDQHRVAKTRFGVDREHDARRPEIGAHHALHANREGDLTMIESLVDAIGDRAIGK